MGRFRENKLEERERRGVGRVATTGDENQLYGASPWERGEMDGEIIISPPREREREKGDRRGEREGEKRKMAGEGEYKIAAEEEREGR